MCIFVRWVIIEMAMNNIKELFVDIDKAIEQKLDTIKVSMKERKLLEDMHKRGICDLRILPSCSMEGSAKYVYEYANKLIKKRY